MAPSRELAATNAASTCGSWRISHAALSLRVMRTTAQERSCDSVALSATATERQTSIRQQRFRSTPALHRDANQRRLASSTTAGNNWDIPRFHDRILDPLLAWPDHARSMGASVAVSVLAVVVEHRAQGRGDFLIVAPQVGRDIQPRVYVSSRKTS
jgi:hypothetical protein